MPHVVNLVVTTLLLDHVIIHDTAYMELPARISLSNASILPEKLLEW